MQTNTHPPINQQTSLSSAEKPLSQDELLQQILLETKNTKRLLQWQMYIIILLVVIPVLAIAFFFPFFARQITDTISTVYIPSK